MYIWALGKMLTNLHDIYKECINNHSLECILTSSTSLSCRPSMAVSYRVQKRNENISNLTQLLLHNTNGENINRSFTSAKLSS